jgi:4-amino-4-deoxy-L-arabinose transferase-like glycosyltransferase
MQPTSFQKGITYVILILSLGLVLIAAWTIFGGFEQVKPAIDSLSADGQVESFTPGVFHALEIVLAVLGTLALVAIIAILIFPGSFFQTLQAISNWFRGIRTLGKDTNTFFRDLKTSFSNQTDLIILLVLFVLGAVLRGFLTNLPMSHDESYTYVVFAARDLGTILQDYHLPNNHVFHTILVHISTLLFDSQPWAVRLPAALSVLGLVPVGYLLGRHYFNRKTGLLVAAAAALLPDFVTTSLNARGYPVVTFLLMVLFLLAIYLKRHNNLFAWIVFIVTAALGFFTLPMMLYGFGMVLGWLFISWLLSDVSPEYPRWAFLRSLLLTGLAVVVLTVLLYTPILLHNGAEKLIAPPIVQQLKVHNLNLLSEDLFARVGSAWQNWHTGFGPWLRYITLIGALWTLLRFRKISRHAVSAFGLGMLWILAVLVIQMIVGWARIWFFLSPIYFMYAFAGILDLLDRLVKPSSRPSAAWLSSGMVMLALLVGSLHWWIQDSGMPDLLAGSRSYTQIAAEIIEQSRKETDLIVVAAPDDAVLWYYSGNLGVTVRQFNLHSKIEYTHAYLVVNIERGQTLESLLASKSLVVPPGSQIDRLDQTGPLEIYYTPIIPPAP